MINRDGIKKNNRVSIPSKIRELLFSDDHFFREVSELNKAKINKNFPKQDQWCDENGFFHIEFALAGYAPEDLLIEIDNDEFVVRTLKLENDTSEKLELSAGKDPTSSEDFYDIPKVKKPSIHNGLISRGIARRNFSYGLIISQEYNLYDMSATMENGLLHILIPRKLEMQRKVITLTKGNTSNGD